MHGLAQLRYLIIYRSYMEINMDRLARILPPPSVSLVYSVKEFNDSIPSLKKVCNVWFGTKPILAKRMQLGEEMYLLSRLIYKYKGAFRRWRVMQKMRQIHCRLKKETLIKSTVLLEEFFANLTGLTAITAKATKSYLPSRQVVQYVLLQLLLSLSLWHDCKILCLQCYGFVCGHLAQEEFVPNMLVIAGVISKIWTLCTKLCTSGIQLYNSLSAVLVNLQAADADLLQPGDSLPAAVSDDFFNKLSRTYLRPSDATEDERDDVTYSVSSAIQQQPSDEDQHGTNGTSGPLSSSSSTAAFTALLGAGTVLETEDLGQPLPANTLREQVKMKKKPALLVERNSEKVDLTRLSDKMTCNRRVTDSNVAQLNMSADEHQASTSLQDAGGREEKKKAKKLGTEERKSKKKVREAAQEELHAETADNNSPSSAGSSKKKKAREAAAATSDDTAADINVVNAMQNSANFEQLLTCVRSCKNHKTMRDGAFNRLCDGLKLLRKKYNKGDASGNVATLEKARRLSIAWVKKYYL